MSLTSFLNSPEGKGLFHRFPDVTNHLIRCEGGMKTHRCDGLVIPRETGADPALIGTAYDFWCRAFIQKINKQPLELEPTEQIQRGLAIIHHREFLTGTAFDNFQLHVYNIWKTRNDYIKGIEIPLIEIAKGAITLAYVEQAMRSGQPRKDYIHIFHENIQDLCHLMEKDIKSPRLLMTKEKIYANPTFGYYSRLIGGADADFVFGTTLIDIKTTVHMKGFQEYYKQLFGYYLLSELDKTFDVSIENLAVYLPRFDALYYIKLDVIRSLIDIDAFAKQFISLLKENEK